MLPTLYDPIGPCNQDSGHIEQHFDDLLIPVQIREDEALMAASLGQPVVEHAPESDARGDVEMLLDWLLAPTITLGRRRGSA